VAKKKTEDGNDKDDFYNFGNGGIVKFCEGGGYFGGTNKVFTNSLVVEIYIYKLIKSPTVCPKKTKLSHFISLNDEVAK